RGAQCQQHQGGGLGNGLSEGNQEVGDCGRLQRFVKVVLQDEEVGDRDGAVVIEVALEPGFARLVEVVLQVEEVGDGDLAIEGGVAGERVFDEDVGGGEGVAVEGGAGGAGGVVAAGGVA